MVNVLFICIGNSCRSQMAEGFARKYGSDVMSVWSAGLAPAPIVQPQTIDSMLEKNIDIQDQYPKSIYELDLNAFDVIVNMSGQAMATGMRGAVLVWEVADPMTQPPEVYVEVRDKIEGLVMKLILELRRQTRSAPAAKPPSTASPQTRPKPVLQTPVPPVKGSPKPADSSRQFGFGRVRRARD